MRQSTYVIQQTIILISNNNKRNKKNNLSATAKAGFYLFMKKLFSLLQMIQLVALLITVCTIGFFLILTNVTQTLRVTTNIEPAASPKYISSNYTSTAHNVESEIPQVAMSRNQIEDARRDLENRKQRITRMCETIGKRKPHLDAALTNMIVDTAHNVSWCPIYKAASSMWMTYFVMLKGVLTDTTKDLIRRDLIQVNNIVRQKFPRDADLNRTYKKIRQTRKFLIVRHPLERLLSAYRDKLEHMQGREYYYKRFGRRITLRYRELDNVNVTAKLEPTFAEFLRFIVNEKHFDEHWAPYYLTCEPCAIQYDYVLKFETLDRDQNFFMQDADLSRYLYEKNYPRNINPYGATTREILAEYIKEIPQLLLDKIYKIYKNDFELFDYSLP
ncbi:carbohydrate sulfotransferase 11-like isoform X2 [Pseudomyrmex gracilis]|uniref:carbohydrate sulfotransferase 11-like isoform X2 n=1 Tax=Pseudomyrmex gracilis TaxID=219809 RepID=UPI000995D8E4|nr:carbohydrate sulfotransferase 11-like isoform X2 [Pseudomyrmex gracilis]